MIGCGVDDVGDGDVMIKRGVDGDCVVIKCGVTLDGDDERCGSGDGCVRCGMNGDGGDVVLKRYGIDDGGDGVVVIGVV